MATLLKTNLLNTLLDDTGFAGIVTIPGTEDEASLLPGQPVPDSLPDAPPIPPDVDNPPSNLQYGDDPGDDPEDSAILSICAKDAYNSEGDGPGTPFTFVVSRDGDMTAAASAYWHVSGNGTNKATAADFAGGVLPSGIVSFAPGELSKTISLSVLGDASYENTEGFAVTLSTPSSGAILGAKTALGHIVDDDRPTVSIQPLDAMKDEGGYYDVNDGSHTIVTPFTFSLTRTGDLGTDSEVRWFVDLSADNHDANHYDFSKLSPLYGVEYFAAGETEKSIVVNVEGDIAEEADETFAVQIIPNYSSDVGIGTGTAKGTILNDDHLSWAKLLGPLGFVWEGDAGITPYIFTLTRTGDLTRSVSVDWSVPALPGSGITAADFAGGILPAGTVTLGAGQNSVTIAIDVAGDTLVEGNDILTVVLSNPSPELVLINRKETMLIRNDDNFAVANSTSMPELTIGNFPAQDMDFFIADLKTFGSDRGDFAPKFLDALTDGTRWPDSGEDMAKWLLDRGDMNPFKMLAEFDPRLESFLAGFADPSAGAVGDGRPAVAGGLDFGADMGLVRPALVRDGYA